MGRPIAPSCGGAKPLSRVHSTGIRMSEDDPRNDEPRRDEPRKPGLLSRLFGREAPAPLSVPEHAPTPEPVTATPGPAPEAPRRSWWTRLRDGLSRSSGAIGTGITDLFTKRKLDE